MDSPIDVVRAFCEAWSKDMATDELMAFFADDAIYHNVPFPDAVIGKDNIAKNIGDYIRPGPPGIDGIRFRLINIVANGPIVMTERVDTFKVPDRTFDLPVAGVFQVENGKIRAWRDYFDTVQFLKGMGDTPLEVVAGEKPQDA